MERKLEKDKIKTIHVMYFLALGLIILAVILGIVFWLKGETKTSGVFPNPESNASLSCKTTGFSYPFFTYDNARKRTIEINVLLDGDELTKIFLAYTLNYDSKDDIDKSEAVNHAAMNKEFAKDELGQDLFESDYAKLNDGVKYTIAADADQIYNKGGAKYFLLKEAGDPPYTAEMIKKSYQQKSIKCEQKD